MSSPLCSVYISKIKRYEEHYLFISTPVCPSSMNPICDLHDSIYCGSPCSKLISLGDKFPSAKIVKASQLLMSFTSMLPYVKHTEWSVCTQQLRFSLPLAISSNFASIQGQGKIPFFRQVLNTLSSRCCRRWSVSLCNFPGYCRILVTFGCPQVQQQNLFSSADQVAQETSMEFQMLTFVTFHAHGERQAGVHRETTFTTLSVVF